MKKQNGLSGIERELVLQYLIDGNVPVTLTPLEENIDSENIHPLTSQIFPIAIKGEQFKVEKNGTILLENPPQAVVKFSNKNVKVEFYFNRVGLWFSSIVKESKKGLVISIPSEIERIEDVVEEKEYDFFALIYFDFKTKKDLNIKCVPFDKAELFSRPVWKSIPLKNQKAAKELLEKFVEEAKKENNAGTGIQLIPVCHYLTSKTSIKMEALENRVKPLNILYVDHERIVLGMETQFCTFFQNEEYGIKLSFSLKKGPIASRDVFITCFVNKIYRSSDEKLSCVDLRFTTLQEEDLRFLYEKTTKSLLI